VRFVNKNIFFYFEKTLQPDTTLKFGSRKIGSSLVIIQKDFWSHWWQGVTRKPTPKKF
jgi:hypothetical protein